MFNSKLYKKYYPIKTDRANKHFQSVNYLKILQILENEKNMTSVIRITPPDSATLKKVRILKEKLTNCSLTIDDINTIISFDNKQYRTSSTSLIISILGIVALIIIFNL